MTPKKGAGDADSDRVAGSPEAVAQAQASLDVLMEAVAKVTGTLNGLEGREIEKHVRDVKSEVRSLVETTRLREQDLEARKAAAQQVERMIDSVAKLGNATGKAVAQQRGQIGQAFRGVDMSKMADGLRVFAEWLRNPTEEGKVQVEQLMEQLQAAMGPASPWDAAREEAEQRKEIDKQVQSSLDDIFRPKPKKP